MEKVWFKLRQTHYPPPTEESMGTDKETGPICLGHFIPSLTQIDFPLNRHQIEEFPDNMPVYSTTAIDFKWENSTKSEIGGELRASMPIAAAAGVTVGASLQQLFTSKITNFEEYDRLQTYTVQINKPYVSDCIDTLSGLGEHTRKHHWTMFVITGLMVARGATKITASESRAVEGEIGPQIDAPGIASATATAKMSRTKEQKMESSGASDFVFAVRLARVHQGILQADWSLDPFTKKATFTAEGEKTDVPAVLSSEGLDGFNIVEDGSLHYDFVIGPQDSPQKGGSPTLENA